MKRIAHLLAGMALLTACSNEQTVTGAMADFEARASVSETAGPAINKDLAALRQATAKFHTLQRAIDAEWSAQITDCMVDPGGAGGMGFHYGNVGLIDGSVQVDRPEVLLYEPGENGKFTLVAVEYIVPYTFRGRDSEPPKLFGHDFKQNDVFQLWGLHAWVWKENPSGMFADWNPKVTCANATAVSKMSH